MREKIESHLIDGETESLSEKDRDSVLIYIASFACRQETRTRTILAALALTSINALLVVIQILLWLSK